MILILDRHPGATKNNFISEQATVSVGESMSLPCLSFARRGARNKLSGILARRSFTYPSVEVTRHFFSQVKSVEHCASTSLDCQLTTVRHRSNRSRRGLYDGRDIRAGNNVSFSMRATKRTFKPNVFKKRVYSEILDEMIRFHITTSALRSIDKAGGLDNYLLNSRHVTEGEGLAAKKRILKVLKHREKKKASAVEENLIDGEDTKGKDE